MQLDMNLPVIIQWLLFVFFIISICVYVAYLVLLIRSRKDQQINIPFFKLTFSMAVADLCRACNSWLAIRIQWWGWIFGHYSHKDDENLPNLPLSVAYFFQIAQVAGIVLIGMDRFSAVIWPFKHAQVWKHKRVLVLIGIQWTFAFLLTIPLFNLGLTWQQDNETIRQIRISNDSSDFAYAYYILGNLFFLIVCCVFVPAFYIILFYYAWNNIHSHNRSSSLDESQSSSPAMALDKNEFQLAVAGLIISVSLLLPFIFSFLASIKDEYDSFYLLYCIALDYFNQSKPYVYLACSKPLRKRFLAMFRGPQAQKKVVPHEDQPEMEMDIPVRQPFSVHRESEHEDELRVREETHLQDKAA